MRETQMGTCSDKDAGDRASGGNDVRLGGSVGLTAGCHVGVEDDISSIIISRMRKVR